MLSNKSLDKLCSKTSRLLTDQPDELSSLRDQIKKDSCNTYGYLTGLYKNKDEFASRHFKIKIQRAYDQYLTEKLEIDSLFQLEKICGNALNLDLVDFALYTEQVKQSQEREWIRLVDSLTSRNNLRLVLRFIHNNRIDKMIF